MVAARGMQKQCGAIVGKMAQQDEADQALAGP